MEEAGWLASEPGTSEQNRKVRFYKLTAAGRRQLGQETTEWERIAKAMSMALRAT
jgi:DNA-binding PadR family transcriptional regulator